MGSPNASAATAANQDSATEADPTTDFVGETQLVSGSDTESNDCGDDLPLLPLPPPPGLSQFEEGEKVLANHSGCFYEAKVLKVEYKVNEWMYLVHYIGWNKSWDEWLSLDCLLKHTEENIEKQRELGLKQGVKSAMAWRVSKMKPRSPNVARGRKRKQDSVDTEKNVVASDNIVLTFNIPPALRKQLIDDCEFVNQMHKLVELPRSPNVVEILKKYIDSIIKKHGRVSDSVEEILKGLRCYFDNALPVMLLYNNERKQYEEIVSSLDNVSPSTVYGAEHLLRLFVKLPELLVHVNMAEETLKELQENFVDILRFLRKNQSLFFVSTYKTVEEMEKKE